MLTILKSRFINFRHTDKTLRWGQAFHQYMEFNKCTQDKVFLDKLYNEPNDAKARQMVRERLDLNN